MRRLIALVLLMISSPGTSWGQVPTPEVDAAAPAPAAPSASDAGAAATASAPAPAATPSLPAEQARQLIETLNDPVKRAQLTTTLDALSKLAPAGAAPAGAVPAAPLAAAAPAAPTAAQAAATTKPTTVPLKPNSLGAQLLLQGSRWVSGLSTQMASTARGIADVPRLWARIVVAARNPESRAALVEAGWRLGLVLACALATEWLLRLALRGALRVLAAHAPMSNGEAEAPPGTTPAVPSSGTNGHRRFSLTRKLFRRLPFALLRLVINLLPIGAFLIVSNLLLGAGIAAANNVRLVILAIVSAYVIVRIIDCITEMFVSPELPQLRLIGMSDQTAAYVRVWVRRLAIVGVFGFAFAEVAVLLGSSSEMREAIEKLVALVDHGFLVVIVLQNRASVAAWLRNLRKTPGPLQIMLNRLASVWHYIAIFYIVALWVVWAAEVRNGYSRLTHFFVVTCAVLIVSRLVGILVLGGLDHGFRIGPEVAGKFPGLEVRANRYYPLIRSALNALLIVVTILALLQVWGLNALAWFAPNHLGSRVVSALITVVIAIAISILVWEAVNSVIDRRLSRLSQEGLFMQASRLRTLQPILRTALFIAILIVVGLTALSEIGVNIAPLLAGAGIVGVAIGFGSQKLVQDFITGIFLLLENAMQVGDWVTVSGLSGSVETLSIRTIRLRAGDGSVHIIPFSSVTTVTNTNKGQGNAAVSVSVSAKEDTDKVSEALKAVASEMRREPPWNDMMRGELELWGVDKIEGSVVTIVGQIVCSDAGRWGVQREYNRRIKKRFEELGIEMANATQSIVIANAGDLAARTPAAPPAKAGPSPTSVAQSPPPAALGHTQ